MPAATAAMNASVTATDRLKLRIRAGSSLSAMNSRMSGWSTRSMPMLAPRRVPPCLIASVATSNTCMNDTGPDAVPPVEATRSPAGRSRENEKPVPPPVFWISAAQRTASKTPVVESSTGTTKQAASWPSGRPAFMSVGEFGHELERGHHPLERGARASATSSAV